MDQKVNELAWVIQFPIPCGSCGKEFLEIIARFVDETEIACRHCNAILDLDTKEWVTLRDSLRNLRVGDRVPIALAKAQS